MRYVLAFLIALISLSAHADWLRSPDPNLTPGKVCVTDLAVICGTKWGKDARHVTPAMREVVFKAYKIPMSARHLPNGKAAFELDHADSRELGGCDATENLWPQSYTGSCNARDKDLLENRFHAEICLKYKTDSIAAQQMLADAQRLIVTDWIGEYGKRFGSCQRHL